MEAVLYSMSISHPARAAGLMLRHKGIEAERVNIPPGSQQLLMRRHGFRHGTVPGLKLDGRHVQGTTEISRALDEICPDPPLFPADPGLRATVEDAESWGDQIYQPVPRRIFRWTAANDRDVRKAMAGSVGLPVPALSSNLLWPVAQFYMRLEGGGELTARRDAERIPEHLDHVDELIAAGTIDGEALNAADFQIATTTRVLLNFSQFRPLVEGRPAGAHAMRVVPEFGRELPARVPESWLVATAR